MSKCFNYLKILTDEEMKDFGVIDFGGRFKSPRKKNRKTIESLCSFSATPEEVKKCVALIEKRQNE